jgi:hypothetical protein
MISFTTRAMDSLACWRKGGLLLEGRATSRSDTFIPRRDSTAYIQALRLDELTGSGRATERGRADVV